MRAVTIQSQDPDAWDHAEAFAAAIGAKAEPRARDYVLLTHTQHQLRGTSLAAHLGDDRAKALLAGRSISMRTGGQLRHATLRTIGSSGRNAVIIAFYADDPMLETLDGSAGIIGIVAVPEFGGEVDGWIARWNPVVDGAQQPAALATLIDDPVVEKALISLTRRINLANGMMNPRDKSHANETLRILRVKGHDLKPIDIKSWAIRNDWKPAAADELGNLASKVATMRSKPSLKNFDNVDAKYKSWEG